MTLFTIYGSFKLRTPKCGTKLYTVTDDFQRKQIASYVDGCVYLCWFGKHFEEVSTNIAKLKNYCNRKWIKNDVEKLTLPHGKNKFKE